MKTFKQFMDEDAPINNVGGGQIAGTKEAGDDPPVNKKKKKNIYLGKLSRTSWLRDVKKNGK
tara:strand:+ start:1187 stop:1372 length:186 start_codon:yes stop_codon:yes gene_type:complete